MVKKSKTPIATVDTFGWNGNHDRVPEAASCKECGARVEPTRKRSDEAFAGHGRPRAFCDAKCRQRFSRRERAKRNSESIRRRGA